MKTKTVRSIPAIFILLLALPSIGHHSKRVTDGDDQNERPGKIARLEQPSDVSMSDDDDSDSYIYWDAQAEEKIAKFQDANPTFSEATALLFASTEADNEMSALEMFKHAIADGADVNAIDSLGGMTALMCFATIGMEDIIALLIERGADSSLTDAQGKSLLIVAMKAEYAQVSTARFLINIGLEIGAEEVQVAFDNAAYYRKFQGNDYEDMCNEWTEFANYLLQERMARLRTVVTTQLATFSQTNLPQNVLVELPVDIVNYIGGFLWMLNNH